MFGRNKWQDIKIIDLTGDTNWIIGSVECADKIDARLAVFAGRPESILADAVGSHHSQAGDDDATHFRTQKQAATWLTCRQRRAIQAEPATFAVRVRSLNRPESPI